MYLSHFGLNQAPFGITPNPAFFYAGNKRGDILEALIYAVTHGEGIVKVTGEVGSGKTMLCRMLESMLPNNIEVIYLVNPTLSREEVVYAIAGELGLATGGKRPDEVIRLLQNDLIAKHVAGKQVVLLVEEAQAMPLDTLEEIRLFSNLETAHHKLLQIVLFGQPELNENLALPRMRQLKERITHSFAVPPLMPEIIPEFLMFRMRAAGYRGPDIFSKAAVKRMADVSEGIVRRISILADKALLAAFADNTYAIEDKHIKAAVRDSEFSNSLARARNKTIRIAGLAVLAVLVITGAVWKISGVTGKNGQAVAIKPIAAAVNHPIIQPASPPAVVVPPVAVAAVPPTTLPAGPPTTIPPAPKTEQPTAAKTNAPVAPVVMPAAAAAPAIAADNSTVTPAATGILQQRLSVSRTWLGTETPERYSIQITLMAADKLPQIERFLNKMQEEIGMEKVFIYPSRINDISRYGVVYGSFATRVEAKAKLVELTDQWGYHPQLRTIAGIRDEIKRWHSEDLWPQQTVAPAKP